MRQRVLLVGFLPFYHSLSGSLCNSALVLLAIMERRSSLGWAAAEVCGTVALRDVPTARSLIPSVLFMNTFGVITQLVFITHLRLSRSATAPCFTTNILILLCFMRASLARGGCEHTHTHAHTLLITGCLFHSACPFVSPFFPFVWVQHLFTQT